MWHRFQKFVLGYVATWIVYLGILFVLLDMLPNTKMEAVAIEKSMWKLFFMLTFTTIGIMIDFKKLAEAKFGKMTGLHYVALF